MTLFAALALAMYAPSQTKLPDGVLHYWDCDSWGAAGWRDNEWAEGGSGRIEYDTEVRKHGAASLRLEGREGKAVSALSLERPATVETGTGYVLKLWAKTQGAVGAQVRALAHGPKPGEQYRPLGWVRLSDKVHLMLPGDSDWTEHRVEIADLPGGATRVFFYLHIEGEGTVWFDEFSFAEAGVDVPLGGQVALRDEDYAGVRFDDADLPENLFVNGSFEEGLTGWPAPRAPDELAGVRTGVARTGEAALRFDAKEFTAANYYQTVDVDPRRYYRISLWARTDGLVGYFFTHLLPRDRHNVPIGWHGANHASEHHYVTGKTEAWEERVLITKFAPHVAGVTIYPRVQDAIGTVWIDDIVIKPLRLDYEPGGEDQ